ncbi:Na+/H+ antiporter NhaC family protein [Vagococcus lutrae]|uniref:YfcC family protein n=1 Tax=Vagococcus lutrae TaxID=81947 RepID=UPI000F878BE1|nr:Na+/H+ antiporter NhaC family protein [Vagococcus lutrae]MCO7150214.1 YfcC family protein [Vagococcus lutrae]MDT2811914.1 Na+/H+ antiporter NhaC family protein [Vagococcus lutrae]MDT2818319.1 Na+/H+ antiporter NhaC family protein [Vagococcus lutrae]MDT2843114.1 Na+/H+ antiporter NhaC family protein [Vagococcus lutrae]RST91246.1 C4-dicarboxylate ABC transporter permease [Vagococcus lutrae]
MKTKEKGSNFAMKTINTLVLLVSIMLIMALLSWIIPAGMFERELVNGRTMIVADSFHFVDKSPIGPFKFLRSFFTAFADVQEIVFFILIAGGSFTIINETGMLKAGIKRLADLFEGKEYLTIPIVMLILSITGSTIGLNEETIVLLILGMSLARQLGYDGLVGMAMIQLGAAAGFNAGVMNPFTVGISQEIAELPLFSGAWLRLIIFFVYWSVTSWMVVRYANRIKKEPEKSYIYELELKEKEEQGNEIEEIIFTKQHGYVTLVFIASFVLLSVGVFKWQWFIPELGAVFLGMGIISGMVGRIPFGKIADLFVEGAKEMLFAALTIVVARGVLVVMSEGIILDTIIYHLTSIITILPGALAGIGMYFIQIIINFLIPSGSGQAAATMPIMVPLADAAGVTRQTAVLAYQFGAGLMDSVIPTSGILMAQLSISKIPYQKWLKFVMPIITVWMILGVVFLLIAYFIGYGPF